MGNLGEFRVDLRTLKSLPGARLNDLGRWVCYGGLGLFAGIAAVFLGIVLWDYPGRLSSLGFYGLLAAFAFVIGMLALRVHMLSPSAEWLALDEGGLSLGYRNGRVRRLDWADPEFYLGMSRTESWTRQGSTHPLTISAGTPYQHYAFLTQPAFEEIIRVARTHGLRVVGGIPGRYGAISTVISRA
jgi:hypothetical protein